MKCEYLGWVKKEMTNVMAQSVKGIGNKGRTQKLTHNYKYYRNGLIVTCVMTSKTTKGVGIAKCKPTDKFNLWTGVRIAEARATSDFYNNLAKKIINEEG